MEHFGKIVKKNLVRLQRVVTSPEDIFAVRPYIHADKNLHAHDCFELAYVTKGSAEHTVNGVTEKVQRGDYFIIDYGSRHSYQNGKDLELINCLFLPEAIEETLAGSESFEDILRVCLIRYHKQYFGKTPVNRIFHDEDGRILQLLLGMQEEYAKKQTGYQDIFRYRLMELIILTMRMIVWKDSAEQMNAPLKSDLIAEMVHYLEGHYTEKNVLGKFCVNSHYNLQYLSRRFKKETGITATEYIQKLRIEKACRLLRGSDLQIREIAHLVGYEDLKFFNKLFLRMLRLTPREYRKIRSFSACYPT